MPAAALSKKVNVDFPKPLFEKTEQASAELKLSRSQLLRRAVEEFLARTESEKLERAIAESLVANSQADREIFEDFKYVDTEA